MSARPGATRRPACSPALAHDTADTVNAQNNGIYDAEPGDPTSAGSTSFRQWCEEILKPAVQS